jgi:hypothetical protein
VPVEIDREPAFRATLGVGNSGFDGDADVAEIGQTEYAAIQERLLLGIYHECKAGNSVSGIGIRELLLAVDRGEQGVARVEFEGDVVYVDTVAARFGRVEHQADVRGALPAKLAQRRYPELLVVGERVRLVAAEIAEAVAAEHGRVGDA